MSLTCLTWSNYALLFFFFFNSMSCFSLKRKTKQNTPSGPSHLHKIHLSELEAQSIKGKTVFFVKISFSKLTHSHPLHPSLYRTYSGNSLLIPEQEDPDTCSHSFYSLPEHITLESSAC